MSSNERLATHEHRPRDFATVHDYQEWNAERWLYPAGSDEAHSHFDAKLKEETAELIEAFDLGDKAHIISELGDQLWCAVALAYNAGISIEDALRYSSVRAVPARPEDGDVTIDEVDKIARDELSYLDTPAVNSSEGMTDQALIQALKSGDVTVAQKVFGELSEHLRRHTTIHRTLQQPQFDLDKPSLNQLRQMDNIARAAVWEELAELLALTSLVAQSHLGTTLEAIMSDTWQKHKERVDSGARVTSDPK
jgi:NTP pyrophosphatase (non-canonical NTP hydrolase)